MPNRRAAEHLRSHRTTAERNLAWGCHGRGIYPPGGVLGSSRDSALSHPNIVQIYDVGVAAGQAGEHYVVMECVEGETLRRRLARVRCPSRSSSTSARS